MQVFSCAKQLLAIHASRVFPVMGRFAHLYQLCYARRSFLASPDRARRARQGHWKSECLLNVESFSPLAVISGDPRSATARSQELNIGSSAKRIECRAYDGVF